MDDAHKAKYATREEWLLAATKALRPLFKDVGHPLPEHIRLSCGFPLGSRKVIGQCWPVAAAGDKVHQIYISPVLDSVLDKAGVLATLVHELGHSALPPKTGHKAAFAKLAADLGLEKPWKATTAGPELLKHLKALAHDLGPYPHAALSPTELERKKQSTRLLKVECGDCEAVYRITAKWANAAAERKGLLCPVCGSDNIILDEPDNEDNHNHV
jgi:hypothetical protein